MSSAANDNDTWQTLAAATAKLLEKHQPDSEKETSESKRTGQTEQRKAERREVLFRFIR